MIKFKARGISPPLAIAIIVVLAAALVGGVFYYQKNISKPGLPLAKEKQEKGEALKKEKADQTKIKEALSLCNKIDDEDERKSCIGLVKGEKERCQGDECMFMAMRTKDPKLCKKVGDEEKFCLALVKKDPTWCNQLEADSRAFCYLFTALLMEDVEVCEKSISPSLCRAIVTKDPAFCEQTSELYRSKENCYYKLGVIKGNSTLCEDVTDLGKKKACQKIAARDISDLTCEEKESKICYFITALKQDPSICEKISQQPRQAECYSTIVFQKLEIWPKYFPIAVEDVLPSLPVTEEEKLREKEELEEKAPGWVSPTGHNDPNNRWVDQYLSYDDSFETYAHTTPDYLPATLEFTHSILRCSKIRFFLDSTYYDSYIRLDIDIYYNRAWHTVVAEKIYRSSEYNSWVEESLGGTYDVTKARIHLEGGGWSDEGGSGSRLRLKEFDFGQ